LANRVLLDQNGLAISRPGVDVLIASPANLMFRSDSTNVPRWIAGSIFGVATVNFNSGAIYSYGRTFSTVPIVTWSRHYEGGVVNGLGTCVNEGNNVGYNRFAWIVRPMRDHLIFNSVPESVLYFKIWEFEA
jgi:hypothetical protein